MTMNYGNSTCCIDDCLFWIIVDGIDFDEG